MTRFDDWDSSPSSDTNKKKEIVVSLDDDVARWPEPKEGIQTKLVLRERPLFGEFEQAELRAKHERLLQAAKERKDMTHVDIHFSSLDEVTLYKLIELLRHDDRVWESFTLNGINEMQLFPTTAPAVKVEELGPLLVAMRNLKKLTLASCNLSRDHSLLETLLKMLPILTDLHELKLHGWQIDRVCTNAMIRTLTGAEAKHLSALSLNSCEFVGGEAVFQKFVGAVKNLANIESLNLSYCGLDDAQVARLAKAYQETGLLRRLHLGGNECMTEESVQALSEWIKSTTTLEDLNLRALWIGFAEGIVQRIVDLSSLYDALGENTTIRRLTLSENFVGSSDVQQLKQAFHNNSNLEFLDISHNPLGAVGANYALAIVNEHRLKDLRFQNHFCRYPSADQIELQLEKNTLDDQLSSLKKKPALAPFILERIQKRTSRGDISKMESSPSLVPDLLFHVLTAPIGEEEHTGMPLVLQATLRKCKALSQF